MDMWPLGKGGSILKGVATLRLRTAALELLFKSRQNLSDFNCGHKHPLPYFTKRVQSTNDH